MESLDVFLIALVIILIIIIVYQNRKFFNTTDVKSTTEEHMWGSDESGVGFGPFGPEYFKSKEHMWGPNESGGPEFFKSKEHMWGPNESGGPKFFKSKEHIGGRKPYYGKPLNKSKFQSYDWDNWGGGGTNPWVPEGFSSSRHQNVTPEQILNAQHEMSASNTFNHETAYDTQACTSGANMDYNEHITDLVVDPKTRQNHKAWAKEMRPYSGTARTVDNMDEAVEQGIHRTGLGRHQSVEQHNPLQVTELDPSHLPSSRAFRFNG